MDAENSVRKEKAEHSSSTKDQQQENDEGGVAKLPPKFPKAQNRNLEVRSPFESEANRPLDQNEEAGGKGKSVFPLKSALSSGQVGISHGISQDDGQMGEGKSIKRNVSWADFSDGNALTTVVEFERDPIPSSPTSLDSWDSEDGQGCCCSVM